MSEKTPQDYANELLKMYRENAQALTENPPLSKRDFDSPFFNDGTGGIQVNVTTLGGLYPVKGALVTIFSGEPNAASIIETDTTDQSGKSKVFELKTPPKSDSQQAQNYTDTPYASYNISVKSDGYVEQIAMNVPVFSEVISVQKIDLLPITAAGKNTSPQIIQEGNNYNL